MRISLLMVGLSALVALPALAQDQSSPANEPPAAATTESTTQPTAESQASEAITEGTAPGQQPSAQQHAAQQEGAHDVHSADSNYRWHNGRWWYWQNGGWLMWNGSRWLNQQDRSQPTYSYAPGRSFSYTEDAQGFVPTDAGIPQSTASGLRRSTVAPGTVQYQRVVPSYGLRSAGSKVLGNY